MKRNPKFQNPALAAGLLSLTCLSLPLQAAEIYNDEFARADNTPAPFSAIGWFAYLTQTTTTVIDWSNDGGPPAFATNSGNDYLFFAPRVNETFLVLNGPGVLFTNLEGTFPIQSITSMKVDANFDASAEDPAFARFVIRVDGQFYASEFLMTSNSEDGPTGPFNPEILEGIDFSDGSNWRLLTATAVEVGAEPGGEITLAGAPVGGTLTGNLESIGFYTEPGNGGDHSRFDNFVVTDDSPELVGLFEEFTNEGPDANLGSIGWSALLTENDVIVEYAPESGPFAAAVSTDDFGFFDPAQDPEVANDPALIFTDKQGDADVTSFVSIDWDGRAQDLNEHVFRPAIRIDGVWYASSTELFVASSVDFNNVLFQPDSFLAADNWLIVENTTPGDPDPLELGDAPEADLTGMVTAYGLYIFAGADSGPDGAQVSFDNFRIDAGFTVEPELGFQIASFTSIGGGMWEITVRGAANTDYVFRSSPTLDFPTGNLIENLTQGDPGDPGTIGGTNNSLITTDGDGSATARLTLSGGSANFVRGESAP
jgi:hypothetical protein